MWGLEEPSDWGWRGNKNQTTHVLLGRQGRGDIRNQGQVRQLVLSTWGTLILRNQGKIKTSLSNRLDFEFLRKIKFRHVTDLKGHKSLMALSIKRWCLFPHPLNVSWPSDLLCPTERRLDGCNFQAEAARGALCSFHSHPIRSLSGCGEAKATLWRYVGPPVTSNDQQTQEWSPVRQFSPIWGFRCPETHK